jgi:hypothetical protein
MARFQIASVILTILERQEEEHQQARINQQGNINRAVQQQVPQSLQPFK